MNEQTRPVKLLDHSTLWPVYVAVFFCMLIVSWRVYFIFQENAWEAGEAPGPAVTNGFDLRTATVPVTTIQRHGIGFEGFKALSDPEHLTPLEFAERRRNKVVDRDRVIGVEINGEARVYPLRIVFWHEIVNDTLGGVPIAVTYSSLSDSVRVFDRRVAGETLSLRFSGLVHNSSSLLYDYHTEFRENNLWRQTDGTAISGDAAADGKRLATLSAKLLPYGEWKALHPNTTIIDGRDKMYRTNYGKRPYDTYFQSGKVLYNVDPMPPAGTTAPMTRTLIARVGEEETTFLFPDLLKQTKDGPWSTKVSGIPVQIHTSRLPDCAWITTQEPAPELETWNAFWFAYYALQNES